MVIKSIEKKKSNGIFESNTASDFKFVWEDIRDTQVSTI